MADFARYLPLSQRSRADERGVTTDRRAPTGTVLRAIAEALRPLDDIGWSSRGDDDHATVADAVAQLMAGFDRRPARRALETAQHALGMDGRAVAPHSPLDGPADAAAATSVPSTTMTLIPRRLRK